MMEESHVEIVHLDPVVDALDQFLQVVCFEGGKNQVENVSFLVVKIDSQVIIPLLNVVQKAQHCLLDLLVDASVSLFVELPLLDLLDEGLELLFLNYLVCVNELNELFFRLAFHDVSFVHVLDHSVYLELLQRKLSEVVPELVEDFVGVHSVEVKQMSLGPVFDVDQAVYEGVFSHSRHLSFQHLGHRQHYLCVQPIEEAPDVLYFLAQSLEEVVFVLHNHDSLRRGGKYFFLDFEQSQTENVVADLPSLLSEFVESFLSLGGIQVTHIPDEFEHDLVR